MAGIPRRLRSPRAVPQHAQTATQRRAARDAELVAGVALALAEAGLDPAAAARAIGDQLARGLGDVCLVAGRSEDGRVVPLDVRSPDEHLRARAREILMPLRWDATTEGLTGQALASRLAVRVTGGPEVLAEVSHPALPPLLTEHGLHSLLIAPMRASGELVGVITLLRGATPDAFDAADEALVQDLADRAGLAFANARLHTELRERERTLRGLVDADVIGVFSGEGTQITDANDAFLTLLGRSRDELESGAMSWPALTPPGHEVVDEAAKAELARQGRNTPYEKEYLRSDGVRVPVLVAAAVLDRDPIRWISVAVDLTDRVHAEEAVRRQARFAGRLTEVADLLQRSPDAGPATLAEVARLVSDTLGTGVWVLLRSDDRLAPVAACDPDPVAGSGWRHLLGEATWPAVDGLLAGIVSGGRPRRLDRDELAGLVESLGAGTVRADGPDHELAALPLNGGTQPLGLILVARASAPYGDDELAFLADVTGRTAVALDHASLRRAQRDTEADLRDSEARYRALFAGGPSVMLLTDPADGRIVDANAAAAEFYGWPVDVLRQMRISDINTLTRQEIAAEMRRAMDRSRRHFEFRHRLADGEVRAVDVYSGPVTVAGRTLLYSMVYDATATKDAEAALAASEARFRAAFAGASVAMALVSLAPGSVGQFVEVNAALSDLTGYPPHALVGMSRQQLTHPDDRDEDATRLAELAAGTRAQDVRDQRVLHADGRTIWARIHASAVTLDGRPNLILHMQDITMARIAQEDMAFRALHDPMTGLANRHLFFDHLRLALNGLPRGGGRVGVFFLDLDGFKSVNDTHGHEAGDRVLIEVGHRLRDALRAPDTAARLAGDEFVAVCPDVGDDAAAIRLAARLADAVNEPIRLGSRAVHPRVSIGIATTDDPGLDAETLLHRADTAMYAAKRRGRDRIEIHRDALDAPTPSISDIEQELQQALEHGWLRLVYQPIFDVATGAIVAAEALLRIDHPERGRLTPDGFIDILENSDLIIPVEEWVLGQACRQLAEWQRITPLDMAVNISGRQISRLAMQHRVLAIARAAGIDPTSLCLEMTERVLVENDRTTLDNLRELSAGGVQIAIDDFGTGYASLAYVQQFPITTVKIDRTFIAGLGDTARDQAIVASITALAHALNLTVVAEGIETAKQLETVRRLGCHRAQGFHLARPLEAEAVTELLRAGGSPVRDGVPQPRAGVRPQPTAGERAGQERNASSDSTTGPGASSA